MSELEGQGLIKRDHHILFMQDKEADDYTENMIFSDQEICKLNSLSEQQKIQCAIDRLNCNQNTEALKILEFLIVTCPHLHGLNYGKAVALSRLGKIQEAVDTLHRLLLVCPDHKKAIHLLEEIKIKFVNDLLKKAQVALQENQANIAFDYLNQAKALKQPTCHLDYLRAICFLNFKQVEDARISLYEELRYHPQNAEAKRLLNQIYEQYPKVSSQSFSEPEFQTLVKAVRPFTMLSEDRLYSLYSKVKQICIENIPGNIVECGVAGGGSTLLMAAVIKRYTKQPRWLYGFDSFQGMPEPTERDKHNGRTANETGWGTGTCAASEANVYDLCSRFGVLDIVKLVKGYFQDTLPKMRDSVGMISLLHLDGDWYESTKIILHTFYDRVVNSGVIQVDDYGYWEGCKQAVHEFENHRKIKFAINPIDQTGIWLTKPDLFPINSTLDRTLVQEFEQDDPIPSGIPSQMSKNERFQMYYVLRQLLPQTSLPLRFVEIGSYAGSSLLLTTQALKRNYFNLQGFAIEPNGQPLFYKVLQHLKQNVTHLPLFSDQATPHLEQLFKQDSVFPVFIFIDGDHRYSGVKQDILNYFPLLAPGGIMMFHDYLPALNEQNQDAILFHHAGNEPGIRQACQELMEDTYGCEVIDIPLLYPTDPTQTQAHLPIIPGVFSTIRAYRKP